MRIASFAVCLLMIATVVPVQGSSFDTAEEDTCERVEDQGKLRDGGRSLDFENMDTHALPGKAAQLAFATQQAAKYEALLTVFTPAELDALDDAVAKLDMLDDAGWDALDEVVLDEVFWSQTSASASSASVKTAARTGDLLENGGASAVLLESVHELAEGATPTMYFLNKLREQSRHQDFWTFDVSLVVFNQACEFTGNEWQHFPYDDKAGRTDIATNLMEFQLAQLTPDINDLSTVDVDGRVEVCQYGWFSGKGKGCDSDTFSGTVSFEYAD